MQSGGRAVSRASVAFAHDAPEGQSWRHAHRAAPYRRRNAQGAQKSPGRSRRSPSPAPFAELSGEGAQWVSSALGESPIGASDPIACTDPSHTRLPVSLTFRAEQGLFPAHRGPSAARWVCPVRDPPDDKPRRRARAH